jgi:Xaa-Pro aminopeptidase
MRQSLLLATLMVVATHATAQPAPTGDAEFRARRDSLVARLPVEAVLVAFGERDEIGFPAFYQSPNFRYLTGLAEPNAILLLVHRSGAEGMLFRQARSPSEILFNGPLEDPASVTQRTGLAVRALQQFTGVVDSLIAAGRPIYFVHDTRSYGGVIDSLTRAAAFVGALRRRSPAPEVRWADSTILALRAKKTDGELALIRESARITSESVNDAIRGIRPGQHEYSVQAAIESGFRARGGDTHTGFATNVSAGENSTTAHHRAGDAPLEAGKLVLMDVGAAYQGYSADLTRTVPVGGRFSPAQRDIYQHVRDAQAAAEHAATLGAPGRAMEDSASATIARGLARLGLIESPDATFDPPWADRCARNPGPCRQSYFFYFHGVGHGIGLDVHDQTQHAGARGIAPGDAFTIEPGIYVDARRLALLADTPKNRAFIAKMRPVIAKYDRIGVRIEDDYVATPRGVERITSAVREIDEIESLMQGPQRP